MKTNADITLYSVVGKNADGKAYARYHIHRANWQGKKRAIIADKGLRTEDSIRIFVLLSNPDIAYLSFKKGDIVVRGRVDFDLDGTDRHREKDLFSAYDDAYTIIAATKNDNGSKRVQHWELEAN
jgi:hypothetical protein